VIKGKRPWGKKASVGGGGAKEGGGGNKSGKTPVGEKKEGAKGHVSMRGAQKVVNRKATKEEKRKKTQGGKSWGTVLNFCYKCGRREKKR